MVGGAHTPAAEWCPARRASMQGMSATSTSLFLVDNAGMPAKTPTKDNRFWLTRTGARRAPMSELAIPSVTSGFTGCSRSDDKSPALPFATVRGYVRDGLSGYGASGTGSMPW